MFDYPFTLPKGNSKTFFLLKAVLPKKWKCPGLSSRSKEQKKEVEHLKRKTMKKTKGDGSSDRKNN